VLDRVPEHHGVAAVPPTHSDRSFVGVLVVLDVGQRHLLGLELVAEFGVQELDGDVVSGPDPGELVEQLVPVFLGALVDDVGAPALRVICHTAIVAPSGPEDQRGFQGARGQQRLVSLLHASRAGRHGRDLMDRMLSYAK
jgi:hypothetical protein